MNNAFPLLEEYRSKMLAFNDDIQGTAAVCLAGILTALRAAGVAPPDARLLFLGAGEAGTGIGSLFALYLASRHGLAPAEGRKRSFFVDSQGLVVASRLGPAGDGLAHHKRDFAHDAPFLRTLLAAVAELRPTALVGVSAQPGAFDSRVLAAFAAGGGRVVFPLSNPTSCAECTCEAAAAAVGDGLLFASGSPFEPVRLPGGGTLSPGQANNALIFPGLGAAALLTRATALPDECFLVAAEALAALVTPEQIGRGELFPPNDEARATNAAVACAVARHMVAAGLGTPRPAVAAGESWESYVGRVLWQPGGAGGDKEADPHAWCD